MIEWEPVVVLPSIDIREPIGGELMALAPRSDQRVEEIVAAHPIFGEFLSRFTDQFGYKVDPTILLARADKPHLTDVEAVAGFRDLVALSIVPYSRAQDLLRPHSWVGVLYGDALAFYPWIIDRHYERLVQRTPAVLSNGPEVHELSGQSSPGLPSGNLAACDIDQPLLDALLKRWRGRYDENVGEDIALFRSLNMAYHASLMPAQTADTFYDRGRLIALWVSAFEILVHPGSGGDANKKKVLELLARVSGKPDSETEGHGLRKQICAELYGRRNDFLHGNPVSPQALRFKQSGRDVGDYAAPSTGLPSPPSYGSNPFCQRHRRLTRPCCQIVWTTIVTSPVTSVFLRKRC